jgi:hypothetical protein
LNEAAGSRPEGAFGVPQLAAAFHCGEMRKSIWMIDSQYLLERQAEWQKKRQSLSWSAKIRMVEAMQGSLRQLRNSGKKPRHNLPIQNSTSPRH